MGLLSRPIAMVSLAVVALVLAMLLLGQCQKSRQASTEASLSAETGRAASDSGKDAVESVGAVSGRNTAIDQTTMENEDAIRSAPGADAPLPAGVTAAGRDGLCRRAAYRCTVECLQRAAAAGVANPGAGCPSPGR